MTAANANPKKTGSGDEGITQRLEVLDIKDQAGEGHDSATGKAGGVARRIKDYCDKVVENLKAGRLREAYRDASKALELDGKDAKAAALYRYTLYALHPEKRRRDKADALCDEADQYIEAGDYDKTLELLALAKKWHGGPSVLLMRSVVNSKHGRFDSAYVDVTEALAAGDALAPMVGLQMSCLHSLGFNVPQVNEPQQVPAHSTHINLLVRLQRGFAEVVNASDYARLMPLIPIQQLARFLNEHVQGAMSIVMFKGGEGHEDVMLRLLDNVTVPGRLHVDTLTFADFFHLPWAGVKRILDGRTLRAKEIHFLRLQLPSGADTNEFLQLPTMRDCSVLMLQLYNLRQSQLPGPPPLFKNTALVEWLKQSDGQGLCLTREYLLSGLLGFLDALKKDFQQATRVHSYAVSINCPHFDVADGLGVRDEQLFNRLGERMAICVGEIPAATVAMGHQFETVAVERFPPT